MLKIHFLLNKSQICPIHHGKRPLVYDKPGKRINEK
jgi:hypothetical protein